MKKIINTFILGLACIITSYSQPYNLTLNTPESGTQLHQALNSITFDAGYSYTPNGGTMVAETLWEPIDGTISYSQAIDPQTYAINTSLSVGKTYGNLSAEGLARYNIPFDIPEGTNGLQPSISLNYTSSFADGMLGTGWNLGGLSAISRVNQTIYNDGKSEAIRGDMTDKYALDGKRLVITSGTYGADNSNYGTELEEFSKIVAHGATGKGPDYFTVYTKSGHIYEYGNSEDSKLNDGTCILSWKLNKISDRYGNYILFNYSTSDDELPIASIEYTGNSSLSKTPFACILFNYKSRTDVSSYVYGGKQFVRNVLLDNIEIKKNGALYKKYMLDYTGNAYAFSQLQKVTEYSSQGAALNPTVFAWTNQTEQFSQTTYGSTLDVLVYTGDFDGDGRDDMVTTPDKTTYSTADKWKLYLADANGNMVYTSQGDLNSSFKTFKVNDFDGDGLTDLMMQENAGTYYHYKSTKTSFTRSSSSYNCPDITRLDIVDYNGDGKLEFLYHETSGAWYLYTYSGSLITSGSIPSFGKWVGSDVEQQRFFDFNGDGCSDLLVFFLTDYKIYEFKGTNNALTETITGTNISSSSFLLFGDYNGDGKTDIIKNAAVPFPWEMISLTSEGLKSGLLDCFDFSTDIATNNNFYTRDMNADGKMDLVMIGKGNSPSNSSTRINVALNSGIDFDVTEYISTSSFAGYYDDIHFGDFNGDGREQFFFKNSSTSKLYSFASGTPSHLINTIIDGYGAKTSLSYLPMSNNSVYTRGTGATYPVCDFSSSSQLVSQVSVDNGIGGTTTLSYQYEGAKIHMQGKGFLCFSKVKATNNATNISTESNYGYNTSYYYPLLQSVYTKRYTTTLSSTINTWTHKVLDATNKRIYPYVSQATQTDNLTGLSKTATTSCDSYGNPSSVAQNFGGGHTQTTSYLYNDEKVSSWLIGRPTTITETSVKDGQTKTFVTTRSYFSTNNSPDIDNYNSGDGSYWKLDRDYDSFGNLWKEHKETTGLSKQTTIFDYDQTDGVHLLKQTSPAGHETSYTYYATTGNIYAVTDPFDNVTTYNYNSADQLSSVSPSNGISQTITSSFNTSGGPANARYYVQNTGGDGSQTKKWLDKLGRELRDENKNLAGSMVKIDTQYNTKGQLAQVSEPSTSTPSNWNIMGYDDYGRPNSKDPYFGPTTTISYSSATTTKSVNSRSYASTIDAAGLVTQSTDPAGNITYSYTPDGQVRATQVLGAVSSSMSYDKNGNRLTLSDPSVGTITNTYYGTGQIKTTTNNSSETTTYTYQSNGLLDYYTAPEGQTNYSYNTSNLVSNITSPGNVTRSYTYEDGKVKTLTESIDGVSNTITFEYDTKGRLYKKYFNGTSDYEQYEYNSYGYLYRVKFNGTTVWQLTSMDEYGHITQATIGSNTCTWGYDSNKLLSSITASGVQQYNYSFDVNTGNLNSRTNYLKSKTETFGYDTDKLDRLTTVTGPVNLSVGYTSNKNGNISTKSDAGTFAYDDSPYAVSSISNAQNISTTQQEVNYYSFEKVKKITEGTKTADFDYNAEHQRVRMVLKDNGTTIKTRWYFNGSCERELQGGVTTQYIWIGGNAYTAVAVAKKVGSGSWTIYNIFRDHLGTITHLKTGSTVTEYSFDVWGRRRDKDDWTYTLTSEPALFADRGFTAHEYLDDFKLYNMNGRLYDPVVGRFLSADPVVQNPGFTQSHNRYSYCMNNPLKYTDPSGYSIDGYDRNEEYYQPLGGGGSLWPKMGTVDSPRNDFEWHWQHAINIDRATKTTQATDALRNDLNKGRYNGYGIRVRPNYNWVGGKGLPTIQKQNGWLISINQSTYVSASVAQSQGGLSGSGAITLGGVGAGLYGDFNRAKGAEKLAHNVDQLLPYSMDINTGNVTWVNPKYLKHANVGRGLSAGADVLTTGIAYYQIADGSAQPITYVDAGVGTMGIIASGASYFYGVQIPVVGEAVAVYGVARVTWDVFFNLGAQYGPSKWYGTDDTKWFK